MARCAAGGTVSSCILLLTFASILIYWNSLDRATQVHVRTVVGIGRPRCVLPSKSSMRTHMLQEQLRTRADKRKYVMLSTFNGGYAVMAMNVKCNMDRVGMRHYTMGALDSRAYAYGIANGLPVFDARAVLEEELAATRAAVATRGSLNPDAAAYNTSGFRALTKLKSKLVLKVLRHGYSVVFSDVDIGWAVHPFVALQPYMHRQESTLFIQSNAPLVVGGMSALTSTNAVVRTEPPAKRRRLNSGLYVVSSTTRMRAAFEKIVETAMRSPLTEQPAFDDVLCAPPNVRREQAGECIGSVRTQTLDRLRFRHGAVFAPSNATNWSAFHANWIEGLEAKRQLLMRRGMWHVYKRGPCDTCTDAPHKTESAPWYGCHAAHASPMDCFAHRGETSSRINCEAPCRLSHAVRSAVV